MTTGTIPLTRGHPATDAGFDMVRRAAGARATRSKIGYERVKRAGDVIISLILLSLLSPLLLLIGLVIVLDTPGPALCVQRRVGKGGRVFRFYKFRSMLNNVDHTIAHRRYSKGYINGHNHQASNFDGEGVFKPAVNGSSITPVGRWLRKYSLDELPQLVNVLKGDMSLVGPRPSMDYEAEEYADWHRQRLQVLPGITGLAQINGRSTLPFDDIARFDIEYIVRRSVWMDACILLKTIPVVLAAHGAR